MIEYKKNAVDLTDLAIGLVVLGIAVSIGATVLINMRNAQVTEVGSESYTQTFVPTDAGTSFTKIWGKAVTNCINKTGPGINSANYTYTVSPDTGVIVFKNTTNSFADTNAQWKCNYTVYNVSDPRYTLPDDASVGLGEYGNWFKIIVIVGVAAVVLSLIFMAFGKGSSAEIGGTY